MDDRIFITDNEPVPSLDERIVFSLEVFGTVKSVNAAGELLTGYKLEELRRMSVVQMFAASGASEIAEQVRRSIRNRVGNVFEVEIVAKDGRVLRLETSLHAVRCQDGTIELQGIAVVRRRARCLDQRFTFLSPSGAKRTCEFV